MGAEERGRIVCVRGGPPTLVAKCPCVQSSGLVGLSRGWGWKRTLALQGKHCYPEGGFPRDSLQLGYANNL